MCVGVGVCGDECGCMWCFVCLVVSVCVVRVCVYGECVNVVVSV